MYNQKAIQLLKIGLAVLAGIFLFVTGYIVSSVTHSAQKTTQHSLIQQKKNEKASSSKQAKESLSSSEVKDFLIAYYTRKDLGENRSRYKPFMTENLYTATLAQEEEPVNAAYKGYVVDQVFEEATIYIDEANQKAIVQVSYSNLLLEEKDNRESLATAQEGKATFRLSYTLEAGRYLVNTMEPIVLSDGSEVTASNYIVQ